ncbi:hypothetical protein H7J07_05410 [Mycobacterium koreense]|uniref:Uncharacterized protein n=1 Tax=Mycolicibacillus koreensis TaxID=1069220 RepID=A0A7I7SD57_9MYCO|nr:hypothetical protein [Mycolicibacillus koreensis]MCV7247662.1 hypothetical protein [Mycolicibacillus koreensis]OSC30619.1 hypothetical protein B8W67_16925 [Mycolicibacillus koreensis]BBY54046.1 hypothetical protein MKOR_12970 [Mycolicibacillus koreensis]
MRRNPIGYATACIRYVHLPKARAALRCRRPSVAHRVASAVDWEGKVVGPLGVLVGGRSGPISDALLAAWQCGDHATVRHILNAAASCYRHDPDGGLGAVSPVSEMDAMWVRRIMYRERGGRALAFQAMWWMALDDQARRAS